MFKAYANYWKNYFNFSGRSRRSEYWWPILINMTIALVLYFLAAGQLVVAVVNETDLGAGGIILAICTILFALANIIPGLAVVIRRLHDTGRSGWWYFISLIPFIGGILMLIFMVQEGNPGVNQYGENPKTA